jgi:hypothetical protein
MEDPESFGKFALHILDILQPYKNSAIIGTISVMAPILKITGVRVGPGRALALGMKSLLFPSSNIDSVRVDLMKKIWESVVNLAPDMFVVVSGQKGIGKTVAISTALRNKCGVVQIDVDAGDSKEAIVVKSLKAIANLQYDNFISPHYSGRRVMLYYRWMFWSRPILVLNAKERELNKPYAEISDAARTLAYDYKLRVIVDGSDNTLPDSLFATLRGEIINVDVMTKKVLEDIPELQYSIEKLRNEKLDDVVYHIVGGVPATYNLLISETRGLDGKDFQNAVDSFLKKLQSKTIVLRGEAELFHPKIGEIYKLFLKTNSVPRSDKLVRSIERSSPNETLPSVFIRDDLHLIPSTKAMAYVLNNGCEKIHTVSQIREILAVKQKPANLT